MSTTKRYQIVRRTGERYGKDQGRIGRPTADKLKAISRARWLTEDTSLPHEVIEEAGRTLTLVASFSPVAGGAPRRNPSAGAVAAAKFREFHRKDPRSTGAFHADLEIPERAWKLGDSIHVLYRSDKVIPETGVQPKKPVDYIHEHDSWGVESFTTMRPHRTPRDQVAVPDFIRDAEYLVLLGQCLGLAYRATATSIVELGSRPPLPELYTTPCGRALLVISGKRELDYLVWGGGLGVEDVGIVG